MLLLATDQLRWSRCIPRGNLEMALEAIMFSSLYFLLSFVYRSPPPSANTLLDAVGVKLEILVSSSFRLTSHCVITSSWVYLWFIEISPLSESAPCIAPIICFFFGICFLEKGEAPSCSGSQQLCAIWTRAPCVWNVRVPKITASEGNKQPLPCMWRHADLESILPAAIRNL